MATTKVTTPKAPQFSPAGGVGSKSGGFTYTPKGWVASSTPIANQSYANAPQYSPAVGVGAKSGNFTYTNQGWVANSAPTAQQTYATPVPAKTTSKSSGSVVNQSFPTSSFSTLAGGEITQQSVSSPTGSLSSNASSVPSSSVVSTNTLGTGAGNQKTDFTGTNPKDYVTDASKYNMTAPSITEADKNVKDAEKNSNDILQQMMESINNTPDTGKIENDLRNRFQIEQKQQQVTALSEQLGAIVAKGQQAQLALPNQGRGIPEFILNGQNAQIARQTAIDSLPVSAALQAAQGNLEMANDSLNKLFQIYSDDATNKYNARNKMYEVVYNAADKKEQRALDNLKTQNDRAYQEQQTIIADKKSYAKMAIANGQSALFSQINNLDTNSPTYQNDLSKLVSQVKDPNFQLDLSIKKQQLANLQKTNSLMGEPTAADKKKEAQALKTSSGQTDVLKEKVSLIDGILESGGMNSRVGTSIVSRTPQGFFGTLGKTLTVVGIPGLLGDAYDKLSGQGQQFSGGVHKLASREFLDTLIAAKQSGATFGSLTDREGDALRASATQLNDWEIKDRNGLGTGVWNIDEESFKKELNNLKRLANTGIQNAQGTVLDQEETSTLDNIFSPDNVAIDPSNYY